MKFILSTHNVTLTKAIEDHILARINQLEHLDRFAIDARVILEHDTTKPTDKQFKCSMRLAMPVRKRIFTISRTLLWIGWLATGVMAAAVIAMLVSWLG